MSYCSGGRAIANMTSQIGQGIVPDIFAMRDFRSFYFMTCLNYIY